MFIIVPFAVISNHRLINSVVLFIIIRQPQCPVVGRRPQHAFSKLACLVLSFSKALPYLVAPVFVQVVSPLLGWSPSSSFLVLWSPSGDTRGPSVIVDAVDVPFQGQSRDTAAAQ